MTIDINYVYREDIDEPNMIEHTVDEQEIQIGEGWQILYVKERPLGIISDHDTAAMSPETELVVSLVPIHKFEFSADTYVVAVIMPNNKVNQYFKINKQR